MAALKLPSYGEPADHPLGPGGTVTAGPRPEIRHADGRFGGRGAVTPRITLALVTAVAGLGLAAPTLAAASTSTDSSAPPVSSNGCSAGAHTLGTPGDRLYPDTGNGGYISVHTDVTMVYDASTNLFSPATTWP